MTEAGPELDRLVAEKVMGWTNLDDMWSPFLRNPSTGLYRKDANQQKTRWAPSTDIRAAWEVVEKLRTDGWAPSLFGPIPEDGPWAGLAIVWYAQLERQWLDRTGKPREFAEDYGDTAPLAICLAALRAVGENL